MDNLKSLPCGIQEFEKIRTGDKLYIDKTDLVYKLANDPQGEAFFLGRPRRFGKTLFISTLQCYFEGRKELFEGLKIMELEKEWKKYEVLRFDLSGCRNAEEFCKKLDSRLSFYENKYGYVKRDGSFATRFSTLIQTTSNLQMERVVVLFDEYDAALQSTLYKEEEHEKVRDEYRSFFPVLKTESLYIYKIILTGIMKFTQLSLFSTLNNVQIISANNDYATVCGFTHEELRNDFKGYVERLADSYGITFEEMFDRIIEKYDGYCFSSCLTKVINPYSLLCAFANNKLKNYWSSSGATKIIMDTIDNGIHKMPNWNGVLIKDDKLENNDADKKSLNLSLYQTGYLTIKEYDREAEQYTIAVPNAEVMDAITELIVPRILCKDEEEIESDIQLIKKSFIVGDLELVMLRLQSLVAGTPYSQDHTAKAIEDRFQFIITQILFLCGFKPQTEVSMATGRIDILCITKWRNAIFELKMTSNGGLDAASEQIEKRRYASLLFNDDKELYTIAVEFDAGQKLLTRYEINKIK